MPVDAYSATNVLRSLIGIAGAVWQVAILSAGLLSMVAGGGGECRRSVLKKEPDRSGVLSSSGRTTPNQCFEESGMRLIMKLISAVAVSSLLAACGSSSSSTSSPSAAASQPSSNAGTAVVKTASVSSLGASVLVGAQGLTLYHLSGEQSGKWICTSAACVKLWHPLRAPAGGTPSGSVGSLGTVRRPGGAMQVTFKGLPLYSFVGDTKPGEAKGQGIKDIGVWTAVTANGSAASKPAAATTTPSTSGGGGYGY